MEPKALIMDLSEFKKSLSAEHPPEGLSLTLRALWTDAKGDWDAAHKTVQGSDERDAARVHAYLHRKEGDDSNAAYWYQRASRPVSEVPLAEEWEQLVEALLRAAK